MVRRNIRRLTFDFDPTRPASEVIKEIQEKAVKEAIKAKVEEAPKGTPVANIVQEFKAPAPVSAPAPAPVAAAPKSDPPNTRFPQRPEPAPAPAPEPPNRVFPQRPEPAPAPAPEPEPIIEPETIIETEEGSATDEEVNAVYQGVYFDFAPGIDPQDVIADPEAFEPEERNPYQAAIEDIGFIPPTPGQIYGDEDAVDIAGNPVNTSNTLLPTPQPLVELTPYAQGGTWYAVTGYPGLPVAYFVEYTLPGGNKIYYYADRKDLDTLEGIGAGKEPPIVGTVSYSDFKQGRIPGGSISDVVGTEEHYSTRVERTLMAPTGDLLLPTWANDDPEIKDLFYIAVAENWSDTKFLREMSKKNSFKERYPAFQDMLSLTGGDHAQALVNYQGYERKVRELNNRYGESADAQALAAEAIKKGFTLDDLQATYDIFERAEQNSDAMLAFQKVINAQGLDFDLTSPQGIVDFFKGAAPTEIYDLYEASSITEQASKLELNDLSVEEALEIARNTPGQLTNQQVSAALQSASQTLLRFREYVDLGAYGLDADQIINLSLGYKEPGGMTETELATALFRIYEKDENLQNLASGLAGSKSFQQKDRQIRSIG
ncbi:MAG: hypothetical protein CMI75_02025 [Candidatus Pelagibacter sp.]|nr:hypothetical protein [Candidatus Pelagibacter sp.]